MSDAVHYDGLFSYWTRRGETWGVRLKYQGRKKSWRGFPDKAMAQHFRDEVRSRRKTGQFIPEKYFLVNGGELLSTTIDHYLSTIEEGVSVQQERVYASFWKKRFPRSTVKSLTVSGLERARSALKDSGGPNEQSNVEVTQYVAWLGHVINHAIARGIAVTNPVSKLTLLPVPPSPQQLSL